LLKLNEFLNRRPQCTPRLSCHVKVPAGPDSTHAPNPPPIVPAASGPTPRHACFSVIRTLWWPNKTETLSMSTPARSNSTAKVSRKRCACPSSKFASLKSLRSRVCQLRTILSSFPMPLQKQKFSVNLGVAASAVTTNSGRTEFTAIPIFYV